MTMGSTKPDIVHYEGLGNIRTIRYGTNLYFSEKDVFKSLDISKGIRKRVLYNLSDNERRIFNDTTINGNNATQYITESAIYLFMVNGDSKKCEIWKSFLCREILPKYHALLQMTVDKYNEHNLKTNHCNDDSAAYVAYDEKYQMYVDCKLIHAEYLSGKIKCPNTIKFIENYIEPIVEDQELDYVEFVPLDEYLNTDMEELYEKDEDDIDDIDPIEEFKRIVNGD